MWPKSQDSDVRVTRWNPDDEDRWLGLVAETEHAYPSGEAHAACIQPIGRRCLGRPPR